MSTPPLKPSSPRLSSAPPPLCLSPRSPRTRSQPQVTQVVITPPVPASPRMSSPRTVTKEESAQIRGVVSQWKRGEFQFDIDDAVRLLLPESIKRKSYAREVYERFVEEVRAEPDQAVLVGSRKALYAASVFAKYSDWLADYNELDASFMNSERSFQKTHPQIYGDEKK